MENTSVSSMLEQKGGNGGPEYAIAVYGDMGAQKSVGDVLGGQDSRIMADVQKAMEVKGGDSKRKTKKSDKKKNSKTKKSDMKRSQKKGGSLRKKEKKESLRKNEKKEKKEKKEEKK